MNDFREHSHAEDLWVQTTAIEDFLVQLLNLVQLLQARKFAGENQCLHKMFIYQQQKCNR